MATSMYQMEIQLYNPEEGVSPLQIFLNVWWVVIKIYISMCVFKADMVAIELVVLLYFELSDYSLEIN